MSGTRQDGDPRLAGATTKGQGGTSLWADAWRRLQKNKLAMGGLVIVVIMSALCLSADFHAPYEPTYGFSWIGDMAPLSTHVNANNKNFLTVGKPAEVPAAYATDPEFVVFLEEEGVEEEFSVRSRRRKVSSIRQTRGALPVEELSASGDQYLVEVKEDGSLGERLDGVSFQVKQRMPEPFSRTRVLILRRVTPPTVVPLTVTTGPGEVDGRAATVVTSIRRAPPGEPAQQLDKLEYDGKDVRRVEVEGEEQIATHLLGTDQQGRDLYSRILFGGKISLSVGLVATIVSLVIGVVFGAISGFVGGRTDLVMMGVVDVLYAIPFMFLVILLMVLFGKNILLLFVALGAVQWLTMARIVRGQILSLREKEFIEAARMSGAGPSAILFGHLIPNVLGVVIVYTTLTIPAVILQESFLAFIGLNVTWNGIALDSWGALVNQGTQASISADKVTRTWLLFWPSAAMAITLFSLNFLGDGLRDALDPQQRGRS